MTYPSDPRPTPTPPTLSSSVRDRSNLHLAYNKAATARPASYYTQAQQVPPAAAKSAPRARYQPTDLQSLSDSLWSAEQDLQNYMYENPDLEFFEDSQQVLRPKGFDLDGEPIYDLDTEGTKLLRQRMGLESQLNYGLEARKRGFISTGIDSGKAYLESERDNAAEAERAYNDYIGRVGDVANLVTHERAQMKSLSDAFNNSQAPDAGVWAGQIVAKPDLQNRVNLGQYRSSIQQTIPQQTPQFRPINYAGGQSYAGGYAAQPPQSNHMTIPNEPVDISTLDPRLQKRLTIQ